MRGGGRAVHVGGRAPAGRRVTFCVWTFCVQSQVAARGLTRCAPLSAGRASVGTLSTTCWPPGRGGSPTGSRDSRPRPRSGRDGAHRPQTASRGPNRGTQSLGCGRGEVAGHCHHHRHRGTGQSGPRAPAPLRRSHPARPRCVLEASRRFYIETGKKLLLFYSDFFLRYLGS